MTAEARPLRWMLRRGGSRRVEPYSRRVTASASISAQSFILGEVRADPARLRGEGGPVSPALVVPLTLALNPQPPERTLVVTDLLGRLHLDRAGQTALGELVRAGSSSQPQGLWASHPGTAATHAVALRIPLAPTQLRALEEAPAQDGHLLLRLELRAAAAWLRQEHQHVLGSGGGSAMELLPLAWVRTDELRLAIPAGPWAEQVLPGLGADRYRTVLVSLPADSPLSPGKPLVRWFDDARARYDRGDYRGCIERCRDVRRAVETALQASKSDPVSAKAASAAGLPAGTTAFLDGVWRALAEVTNEAHHPEHAEPVYRATDARAVLLTTAVMLEYLSAVLVPPALP
jgi:hypothetical protein